MCHRSHVACDGDEYIRTQQVSYYGVLVVYCGVIRWMDQLVVVLRDREGIMRLGVLYYINILLC